MNKYDFIAIAVAVLGCVPTVVSAKPVAKPTPAPQIVYVKEKDPVDYNVIIDDAEKELDKQKANLDEAAKHIKELETQLATTSMFLTNAQAELAKLQKDIDKQTIDLNETVAKYNDAVREVQVWKEKHAECLKKLNWWRGVAATITGLIALYGVFLALKAFGKLPF